MDETVDGGDPDEEGRFADLRVRMLRAHLRNAEHPRRRPSAGGEGGRTVMRKFTCVAALFLTTTLASGQNRPAKTLDIYVVDVEGGNATLVVSPARESLLIDT